MVEFPFHPGALTAAWLTDCLRASGAVDQAAVVSLGCVPVDPGNGVTSVVVRVSLTYDLEEPQAPITLVAKFSDPDPEFRAMVHSMGFYEREVMFYSEFAADTPVAVPRCYFAGIDKEQGLSLVLLQDLAPARNGSWVRGFSLADLRMAVAGIASAHAAWWQSPRLESASWLSMTGFLAVDQMQEVVARCWQPFLARLSVPVTPEITGAGELAMHHLRQVCTHLFETPPFTLVHHDFDGENLFFSVIDGQPSIAIIDWQLTTRARGPLDVAWLIGSQCEPTAFAGGAHDDLAIGAPRDGASGFADGAGSVNVIYGSKNGLSAKGNQLWSQKTKGIAGKPEPNDGFGHTLAAANFGRDVKGRPFADLAVGVPRDSVGRKDEAGSVNLLFGTSHGLTARHSRRVTQDTRGIRGTVEELEWLGSTLAAGNFGNNFNGGRYADLAIRIEQERVGVDVTSAVSVVYGSRPGLSAARDQIWTTASFGRSLYLPTPFGSSLESG